MTQEEIDARCEAYDECVLHLELNWTDNPVERSQGFIVADTLRRQSMRFYRREMDKLHGKIKKTPS